MKVRGFDSVFRANAAKRPGPNAKIVLVPVYPGTPGTRVGIPTIDGCHPYLFKRHRESRDAALTPVPALKIEIDDEWHDAVWFPGKSWAGQKSHKNSRVCREP